MAKDKAEKEGIFGGEAPTSEPPKGALVPFVGGLAKAFESVVPRAEDFAPTFREKPPVSFIQVRQKDLLDPRTGKAVRGAGGFKVSDPMATEQPPDIESLMVTVLAVSPGRVFFEGLKATQPTCKSNDGVVGSLARKGDLYGACVTCRLSQWGSGENGRQACREVRNIVCFDWSTEKPIVLTLGPSSIKMKEKDEKIGAVMWRQYERAMDDLAIAQFGKPAWIHHYVMVKINARFKATPAAHYLVSFEEPVPVPMELHEQMAELRDMAQRHLGTYVDAKVHEAEDYVGAQEPTA